MNEQNTEEIGYRRLAFRLFDKGKSPAEILSRIPRSRTWLFKWKQRFEKFGWQAFDSLSKAPHHSPQRYSSEVVKLVLRVRKRLKKSRVGLISARAIRQELSRPPRLISSVPSESTIKRCLRRAGLIDSPAEPDPEIYFPAPQPRDDLVIFSCDWTARYLPGGQKVFVFHTIDLLTHALAQTIRTDKGAASACDHLLWSCSRLGLPDFLQIDNDAAFTGLGRAKRVFGRFARIALYLGIELVFIPPAEPERNHVVERVNGLWSKQFWKRNYFSSLAHLKRKSPEFFSWYETYAPPSLGGLTIKQAARQQRLTKLLLRQVRQLPQELPLTAGRLHFIRQVDPQGEINLLKEQWKVSKSLKNRYVWATLDLCQEEIFFYHRRSLRTPPKLIKQGAFPLDEKVHRLLPEFRRRARRVDILKII
jgi:transposase InsO family protein